MELSLDNGSLDSDRSYNFILLFISIVPSKKICGILK